MEGLTKAHTFNGLIHKYFYPLSASDTDPLEVTVVFSLLSFGLTKHQERVGERRNEQQKLRDSGN
ncbi:MAG: hypothetical protein EBV05_02445 [Cyanobacteria bacterium WB6_1B_304]|jgi:hypothetical protein|nr:hypothetical protein [Cyanobacteria bacterium WB6_1B_304]